MCVELCLIWGFAAIDQIEHNHCVYMLLVIAGRLVVPNEMWTIVTYNRYH